MDSHSARYREIARVLAQFGFESVVDTAGFGRWTGRRVPRREPEVRSIARRLTLALGELGPTFVKLGQALSTRPDVIPKVFVDELAALQDDAPAVEWPIIRSIVEEELGMAVEDAFSAVDPTPPASASIGQVHGVTLLDGASAVVKVRRPDAVARVDEDLEILRVLASRAARLWEPARSADVSGLVQEFAETIRAELDYTKEARNAERFARNFASRDDVIVPRVTWETTTASVLTLERVGGIKVDDVAALDAAGIDRPALARRGADIVLQMIFEDRFLHADLQPGNLFIQQDGAIALVDFGMVGEIPDDLREDLATFLIAFAARDADLLSDAVLDLTVATGPVDRDGLRVAMIGFVAEYRGRPLGEIRFAHLLALLFSILRDGYLRLPREIAVVFKVLLTIEGIGLVLDPTFQLAEAIDPYARRLVGERFSAAAILRRAAEASRAAGGLALDLPAAIRRLIDETGRGGLQLHIRAAELDPLVRRAETIGNRLVAGMVVAALIGGVGRLTTEGRRWRSWQDALMGSGVTITGGLALYLALTSRHRRGR